VNQKPAVQNLMQAPLFIELALFFTDIFKVIDIRVQVRGQEYAQLLKQRVGSRWLADPECAVFRMRKERRDLVAQQAT